VAERVGVKPHSPAEKHCCPSELISVPSDDEEEKILVHHGNREQVPSRVEPNVKDKKDG